MQARNPIHSVLTACASRLRITHHSKIKRTSKYDRGYVERMIIKERFRPKCDSPSLFGKITYGNRISSLQKDHHRLDFRIRSIFAHKFFVVLDIYRCSNKRFTIVRLFSWKIESKKETTFEMLSRNSLSTLFELCTRNHCYTPSQHLCYREEDVE